MARPGLIIHPKFRRLVHVLQEPVPHVVGYLEVMWHVGYETGDALLGDEVDVELAAQYPGPAGKLAKALLQCGFVDALGEGRYAIHDLLDNAPAYVQDRARKTAEHRKEKRCAVCGIVYHSTESHAKYCSPGCRQAHYRQGEGVTRVTDPSVTVTDPSVFVTERDALPLPSPPLPEASPNGDVSATPTDSPPVSFEEFQKAWNAAGCFPKCDKRTDKRKRSFRARMKNPSWVSSWRDALARAATSAFLRGETGGTWVANVDWFLKPDSVTGILEGKYDGGHAAANGKPLGPPALKKTTEQIGAETLAQRERSAQQAAEAKATLTPEMLERLRSFTKGIDS